MQKITPFLWFNDNAEAAMNFYSTVFKNSKIINANRAIAGGPWAEGTIMTGTIELEGQQYMVMNGGPHFKFNEAISLFVNCETQEEVDELWEKLSEGGERSRCGWLKDKFGLSWQIIPTKLGELMYDKDPAKAKAVLAAMMKMDKIIIKDIQAAYDGA